MIPQIYTFKSNSQERIHSILLKKFEQIQKNVLYRYKNKIYTIIRNGIYDVQTDKKCTN